MSGVSKEDLAILAGWAMDPLERLMRMGKAEVDLKGPTPSESWLSRRVEAYQRLRELGLTDSAIVWLTDNNPSVLENFHA